MIENFTGKNIETLVDLEERLSRPTDADVAVLSTLQGDILILGAGGKMGPSLARLARRAADSASGSRRIIAAARFTDPNLMRELQSHGVETISTDLLVPGALEALPDAPNVIFMAARKFGTGGSEHLTWAMNTYLPGRVAERYGRSRIAAFSTGNVYPLQPVEHGGAAESVAPAPVGEYAQSALGRERMFEYGSALWGTRVSVLRLNYAVELRYGVLLDIGRAVFEKRAVDLRMGLVNVIWQRDANSIALRSLVHCASPPTIFNVTGPETLSVRWIAGQFAKLFETEPVFDGTEANTALLNDAGKAHRIFGYPSITPAELIAWTAHWISRAGPTLDRPTHFAVRDGKF